MTGDKFYITGAISFKKSVTAPPNGTPTDELRVQIETVMPQLIRGLIAANFDEVSIGGLMVTSIPGQTEEPGEEGAAE